LTLPLPPRAFMIFAAGLGGLAVGRGAAQSPAAWRTIASLPTPRQEVGVAALDGKVYVVAGIVASRGSVRTVERYDPLTGAWESLPDLPSATGLNHVGAAAAGGKLYVVGGLIPNLSAGVNTTFCFDPSTGSWSRQADMPTARGASGVAAVDGLLYVAGGSPSARHRDFAVYDPAEDRWSELPPMPTGRDHLAAAPLDGRFVAISGRESFPSGLLAAVEAYDPTTGQWSSLPPIPTPRGGIAAAVIQRRIYVFGGEGNAASPTGVFDNAEVYDPDQGSWSALPPMAVPRHGIGAAALQGRVYLPGGATTQGFGVTGHADVFIPPLPSPSDVLAHLLGQSGASAGLDLNDDGAVDTADLLWLILETR